MADDWKDMGTVDWEEAKPPKTRGQAAKEMFTDIWPEMKAEVDRSLGSIKDFGDWAKGEGAQEATPGSVGRGLMKGVGALGATAYLGSGGSAIVGATKSLVGHGGEALFGPENVDYEGAKQGMDVGAAVGGGAAAVKNFAQWFRGRGGKMEMPAAPAEATSRAEAQTFAGRLDPAGQIRAGSAEEGAKLMSYGMRRAAELEQKQIAGHFSLASGPANKPADKPAAIHADAVMALPQKMEMDLQQQRIIIDSIGNETPQASKMRKDIQRVVGEVTEANKGVAPGLVTNVNLSNIDQLKQRLNMFRRAAMESKNQNDIKAAQGVMESFDKQLDDIVNSGQFKGSKLNVQAWNVGRARENLYKQNFETNPRNPVGAVVEKVIGENPHSPQVGKQVGDFLFGTIGVNPPAFNAAAAKHFKSILGVNSPEWIAGKQGYVRNVIQPQPGEWDTHLIKQRVLNALDGEGKAVTNEVLSPRERAAFRQFAHMQGTLDVAAGKQSTQKVAAKISAAVARMFESKLGEAGKAIHAGAKLGKAYMDASKELSDLQAKLPKMHRDVQKWLAEVDRAEKHNVGLPRERQRKIYTATATLSQSLRRLGIGGITPPQMAKPEGEDKLTAERAFGGPQF